jgi:hypothetical protein
MRRTVGLDLSLFFGSFAAGIVRAANGFIVLERAVILI